VSEAAAETAALLETLWKKNLPVLRERMGVFTRAAEAADAGALSEELRAETAGIAHKMAGSLGMYGYPEGTRIAREIEVALGEGDAGRLSELVSSLRGVLPL